MNEGVALSEPTSWSPSTDTQPSALGSLPLVKWAMRLKRGAVHVRGELPAPISLPLGAGLLVVPAGAVEAELQFVGGPIPWIAGVSVRAAGLEVVTLDARCTGERVRVDPDALWVDAERLDGLGEVHTGRLMERLVAEIGSVAVSARAEPDGDLLLKLGGGVEVVIPEGILLTVSGASVGPSHELQLCEPLTVGFGGEGLRLSHEQFRWLSRLATVRLGRATLHPDGSVALEGRGPRHVEIAMRAPLQRASARISDMVRRSPHFSPLRAFLKRGGP